MAARLGPAPVRAVVLFLSTLVLGVILVGCGSGGGESGNAPADTAEKAAPEKTAEATAAEKRQGGAEEANRTATVRLSGTEGTIYAGNYGNLDKSEYAEGVFEAKPVEFTVDLRDSGFDAVYASFVKPAANDDGLLKIEILSGGEVVAQQDAESQYGALNLTWSSES